MTPLAVAIKYATEQHDGQVDKAGRPYIYHPLRVMRRVAHMGVEYAIMGVLHDILEDTPTTTETLRGMGFTPLIIDGLVALTHHTYSARSPMTYRQYIEVCASHPHAREVKIADVLDNLDPQRLALITDVRTRGSLFKRYMEALDILNYGKEAA